MSAPELERLISSLSPSEMESITHLSRQYGTPVPKLIERLHRNRVEAEMVAAIEGITTQDFYLRRIAQIKAQLEEFQ